MNKILQSQNKKPKQTIHGIILMLLFLSACFLYACGSLRSAEVIFDQYGYTVKIPRDWVQFKNMGYLFMTRSGPALQSITIKEWQVDAPLTYTLQKIAEGMLPLEASEVVLADIQLNEAISHVKIIENKPAAVAGFPAFRVLVSYRDKNALSYKAVYYGMLKNDWFYLFRYAATQRHYFDQDLGVFEDVVRSFQLK